FGMHGPLLGERGQTLQLSAQDTPEVMGKRSDFFLDLRSQIVAKVLKEMPRAFIGIGDVTEFIINKGKVFGVDKCGILINGYRQCSLSAYARSVNANGLVLDPDFFNRFC